MRWGISWCVSKVDKHVDDVDKWWKIMRCGDYLQPERVKKAIELGELTRADLEHCARRVLELILKID